MMTNCFYNQLPNKLSKEEQDALLTEYYKTNNEQIREKLILHNIKLILYLVNKYFKNIPIEYNDLVSIGTVGLIRSIDNFDIKKNVSFSTFAAKCIITEIKSFLIKQHILNNKEITINLKNSDNDEIFSFLDIIYDETINIEDIYERNDQIHRLRDILSNLSEKEYEIISLRFGFDNNEPHTLDELSKKYNFSRQYANVTIRKILNKIKTELVGIEIKEKML